MLSIFSFTVLGMFGIPAIGQSLDEIVLIVENTAVTGREFSVLRALQEPNQRYKSVLPVLGEETTDAIIDELILASHAKRVAKNFKVPDKQLKAAINALALQNKISAEQLLQRLKSQGVDIAIFEDSMRKRLLIQLILGRGLSQDIKVTAAQIQEFIDSRPELRRLTQKNYHVSHLMIPLASDISGQKMDSIRETAQQIQNELSSGVSFGQIIENNSIVQSSSPDGDLGWKKPDELPALFVQTLKNLQKGQVSDVLETDNGLHILALTEIQSASGDDKEYRVSHILKAVPAVADSDAIRKEMFNLQQQILVGINFKALAEQESQDTGSASKGGDLGWISLSQVDKTFALALKNLKPGEISEPVQTKFGWHLIRLQQVRKQTKASTLHKNIEQQILSTKVNERMADLLNDLKQVALVEVVVQ